MGTMCEIWRSTEDSYFEPLAQSGLAARGIARIGIANRRETTVAVIQQF
jgi:glycerol kinase